MSETKDLEQAAANDVVTVQVTNNTGLSFHRNKLKIASLREAVKQPQEFQMSRESAVDLVAYCERQNNAGIYAEIVSTDDEKARLIQEEADKQKLLDDEADKARLAQEEADKQKLLDDEADKARLAQEEADKQKLLDDEAEKARLAKEEADKANAAKDKTNKAGQSKTKEGSAE